METEYTEFTELTVLVHSSSEPTGVGEGECVGKYPLQKKMK